MKLTILLILITVSFNLLSFGQIELKVDLPEVPYESEYVFGSSNQFEITYLDKKGKIRDTHNYTANYSEDYKHVDVWFNTRNTHTIFDMNNESLISYYGELGTTQGIAAKMKPLDQNNNSTLACTPTEETKVILGYPCIKYTFSTPKFTGEFWASNEILNVPNSIGIYKISKMGMYFKEPNIDGFIMEITSVNKKGKKAVMKTTALFEEQEMTITIPADFPQAANKANYYAY